MYISAEQKENARVYLARIKKLQETHSPEGRQEAILALIRTGVLTEDGEKKEVIVSWD